MQAKSSKAIELNKIIGEVVRELRIKKNISLTQFAYSYDISKSTLSDLENGQGYCKVATLWKIINALDMKCSDFIALVEEKLGEDFTLIDE